MEMVAQAFASRKRVGSALSLKVKDHSASMTQMFAEMAGLVLEKNAMISTLLVAMVAQHNAISRQGIRALEPNALRHAETESLKAKLSTMMMGRLQTTKNNATAR